VHLEGDSYSCEGNVSKKVSMRDGVEAQVTLKDSEAESQNHKSIIVLNTSRSKGLT
jgi:hypothetical protein